MVGPNPAMPSRTLFPNKAIQTPDRTDRFGHRTAEGLPGWVSKYKSARCAAAIWFILLAVICCNYVLAVAGGFAWIGGPKYPKNSQRHIRQRDKWRASPWRGDEGPAFWQERRATSLDAGENLSGSGHSSFPCGESRSHRDDAALASSSKKFPRRRTAPGSHKSIRSARTGIPASGIAAAIFLGSRSPRKRVFGARLSSPDIGCIDVRPQARARSEIHRRSEGNRVCPRPTGIRGAQS
jgi:hypothetical protein